MIKGDSAFEYFTNYNKEMCEALKCLAPSKLDSVAAKLIEAVKNERRIFVCGNGGSAAIAEHWTCDHMKGVAKDSTLNPMIHSLTSNVSLLTAIANDISYDDVFSYQIEKLSCPMDVLICVSSSGNSPNILKALKKGVELGLTTIALTGFTGGQAAGLAHYSIHIPVANYGIVEDCHQIIMHTLAQFIRKSHLIQGDREVIF